MKNKEVRHPEPPRWYLINETYGSDIESGLRRIKIMKEQMRFYINMIDREDMVYEHASVLPLLKSLYEDLLYVDYVMHCAYDKEPDPDVENIGETEV